MGKGENKMTRYIDINNINLRGIAVFDQDFEALIPLSDVRMALQTTPTADVQEINHGKWYTTTTIRRYPSSSSWTE